MRLFFSPLSLFPSTSPLPNYYCSPAGQGRAASIQFADPSSLRVRLQQKIESGDVKNGKLVPLAREEMTRRGGKRSVTMEVPYENAEALHRALGCALKAARKERFRYAFSMYLFEAATAACSPRKWLFGRA